MCNSVLQYVTKTVCIMVQCVALCCSMLKVVAVCCRALQCVAVRCSVLQYVADLLKCAQRVCAYRMPIYMVQSVAVCYRALRCVAILQIQICAESVCIDDYFCNGAVSCRVLQ